MKPNHIVGTSIPRFTYDTPFVPGNDFYTLCDDDQPLMLIFLPSFEHPISREYIARYIRTLPQLRGARLACVVRSRPQSIAETLRGKTLPFPLLCDAEGVLYSYFSVEQTNNLLNWSFAARRIFKDAKTHGYEFDKNEPQILPLTLIFGREGKILFAHYGRSLTDLPEDCAAITALVASFFQKEQYDTAQTSTAPHTAIVPAASSRTNDLADDETIQLPALGDVDDDLFN